MVNAFFAGAMVTAAALEQFGLFDAPGRMALSAAAGLLTLLMVAGAPRYARALAKAKSSS